MKKILIALSLAFCAATACPARDWETDFAKASAQAKTANKIMLLDFTGSDWCSWCMKLDKEVFSKKAFKDYAAANLVCVTVDFPQQKSQSKALKKQNAELMQKYGVSSFPTIVLLSPDGMEIVGRTKYLPGGAENYVKHLQGLIDPYRAQHPAAGAAAGK